MADTTSQEEAQRYINVALREINTGNYDNAFKLLKKARELYPESQTDELQQLLAKLNANATKSTPQKSSTESSAECSTHSTSANGSESPTRLRQRRQNNNKTASSVAGNHEYTKEQLDLVKRINKCKNFYQVLNVSRDATDSDIKRAYKRLALQLHPDKNQAPGAAEAFKTLGNAVAVLTDERRRKDYDAAGANTLSANGSNAHLNAHHHHQHQHHHQPSFNGGFFTQHSTDGGGNAFEGAFGEDITAEELFNIFFGNFPSQGHAHGADGAGVGAGGAQRRAYRPANQRQPQERNQPSLVFGLILVLIFISMLSSFFTSDPVYSLVQSSKYPLERQTQHLSVPYYVKSSFNADYHGTLGRLENSVEEDFIYMMKQNCYRERSYHEIDELIEKLKSTSVSVATSENSSDDNNTTTTTTNSILTKLSATKDPKLFDKHELAELFMKLSHSDELIIRKEAAKCIAEITKSEVQRTKFTKREIIEEFINSLRDLPPADGNLELPIQICRVLGNICYLNDEARDIILALHGDEVLVRLLDMTKIADTENAQQFIKVRGGLLSNYLLGGEGLAKRAMDLQIMPKLEKIIMIGASNVEANEDLLLNTLPLLSILTENVADLNFDASLNVQLSHILAASTNPDLAEMCLELLHYQAENEDVKVLLAKDGLCETIYNLLEKYKTLASTNEARALMKLACELIVLILTGDESMHYLYSTPLLKSMEDWLDSTDIDLLTTGVLALGNFARTDSHCIYMVENKIMNKLLDVLAKNNGVKDDVRLQHALLSALRNLVIPKPNKNAVIQAGLVETILPMLEIHQPPVVFKLLGTLRMTVDGQEKLALELLCNKTLMDQLVHWSKSSDYAGVTGESLRLMAWLIKHAYLGRIAYALPRKGDAPVEQFADKLPPEDYDRSSLKAFIANEGTVEAMINMLTSQHLVMQNEALIALCILSVVYLTNSKAAKEDDVKLDEIFIKYDVGAKLAELIRKSSDTMTKEIVENLQNFNNLLRTSPKLVKHLEETNINELLKSIPILTEYCTL